jgi:hypothetical protein
MPWASCALKEAVRRRFRALESASCQVKHPACRCRSVANRSRANVLTGTLTTVGSSRGALANQAALRVLPCQRCNAAPNLGGVRQTFESATRASAFFNDRVPLRPERPSVRTSCTLPLRFRLGHARPPPAWSSATRPGQFRENPPPESSSLPLCIQPASICRYWPRWFCPHCCIRSACCSLRSRARSMGPRSRALCGPSTSLLRRSCHRCAILDMRAWR